MGYDRGDSFPFDFGPNGIPFGLKSKGKTSENFRTCIDKSNEWVYCSWIYHRNNISDEQRYKSMQIIMCKNICK